MAEITLDKIKALLNDSYFTREMIEQKIQDVTGINFAEITKSMKLSNDEYANVLFEKLMELKRSSDELKKKFAVDDTPLEIKTGA
jgi:hypothetical protein